MGNLCNTTEGLNDFSIAVKDQIKRKATFQYQITHFKMLSKEKKVLPTFQEISESKIMKIKNTKRMRDLRQLINKIPRKIEDLKDQKKIKELENHIELEFNKVKVDLNHLKTEEFQLAENKQRLNKLINDKDIMDIKHKALIRRSQKIEFIRRYSMSNAENTIMEKLRKQHKGHHSNNLNRRIGHCIRRIERLEKSSESTRSTILFNLQKKYSALESKISLFKSEKEELMSLKSLDEIEAGFSESMSKMDEELNFIRNENEKIMKMNEALQSELHKH